VKGTNQGDQIVILQGAKSNMEKGQKIAKDQSKILGPTSFIWDQIS